MGVRFIVVNDHCDSQDNVGSMEYRSGKLSRDGFMVKKTEQVKEAEDLVLLFKEAKAAYEKYQEEGLEKKETEEQLNQYAPDLARHGYKNEGDGGNEEDVAGKKMV